MVPLQLFLSYSSVDRPAVIAVQKLLEGRGITSFLDRDQLVPGLPWPVALENGLRSARAVAVFIGKELGAWQKREMWFALDRQVREEKDGRQFPVIPVLLPGADITAGFQFVNTWIDLRAGIDQISGEALDAFELAMASAVTAPGPSCSVLSTCDTSLSVCPYRGLEAFREEDAAFFCGRTAFTQELLKFTLGKDLVSVVGPSGSGKSSVVHAGLVPLLRRQLPPATTWDSVSFTPGSDPFHRLASAMIPLLDSNTNIINRLALAEELGANIRDGKARVESIIDSVIEKSNGTGRLLVIADQFEELFTISPESCRRPFARALLGALGKARFTLLVTLRADFYSQIIALDRELSDRLAPAQVNIGALTEDELRQSIVQPAELVGINFESGLLDRILSDSGNEPGNLPLLQFALTGLWSKRKNRTLTNADYDSIGGVSGALAQRAELEFADFTSEEQTAARRLFSRMVRVARPEEGTEDTRQRLDLEQMDTMTGRVAQKLAGADVRLLVIGGPDTAEKNGRQTVELAHEALIRNWKRLREWLNEDREFLLWRQRTRIQVEQWNVHQRDAGYLLRGAALSEGEQWFIGRPKDLVTDEQEFLAASLELRRQENREDERRRDHEIETAKHLKDAAEARANAEARRARILRRSLLVFGFLVLLAVGTAIYALWQRATARAREFTALSESAEDVDPEFSILAAAQAVAATWPWDHTVLPEAERQLHRSIAASHVRLTLASHESSVTSVAWSPDGKRLATSSADETARVWAADDGKQLLILSGHKDGVSSVAWSPDSKRIATGSWDSTCKVWDAATGKELLTLTGSQSGLSSVTWSPDGKRLATGGKDKKVRIWSPENGEELLTLDQSDAIESLAWSPDGRRLATGSADSKITIWDIDTGKESMTMRSPNREVNSVVWSPDGTRLASDGIALAWSVEVWNASTGKRLLALSSPTPVLSVAWSPNGSYLATGRNDETVRIFGAETGHELLVLRGHTGSVSSVAWSPNSQQVVSGSDDNTIKVWDIKRSEEFPSYDPGYSRVRRLAWNPHSKRLAMAGWGPASIWDVETGREFLKLADSTNWTSTLDWSPDGRRLATGGPQSASKIWDAETGKELLNLGDESRKIYDLAWSPDGTRLATGGFDGAATIRNADTGKELLTLANNKDDWVSSIAWSPDSKRVATGGRGSVIIWDALTGRQLLTLSGNGRSIESIAWNPDGKRLAAAIDDNTVEVWDCSNGRKLQALGVHRDDIVTGTWSVVWSPDGKRLAMGGKEVVRVWNTETGVEVLTFDSDGSVAWSPDGSRLAISIGNVSIYAMDIRHLVSVAHDHVTDHPSRESCKKYLQVEKCPSFPSLAWW